MGTQELTFQADPSGDSSLSESDSNTRLPPLFVGSQGGFCGTPDSTFISLRGTCPREDSPTTTVPLRVYACEQDL